MASACGALPWLRGHRCPRCALPRHRSGCPAAAAAFDRAWAPLAYEGAARDLVRALKFRRRAPARRPDGARTWPPTCPADLAGAAASCRSRAHRGRRRRRGFDPAALLADGLAERDRAAALAVPAAGRPRGAGRSARGATLRRSAGRFAAVATAAPPRAAVLVDDVHTTGATLDACARALKERGAEWVGAATYVRTL